MYVLDSHFLQVFSRVYYSPDIHPLENIARRGNLVWNPFGIPLSLSSVISNYNKDTDLGT